MDGYLQALLDECDQELGNKLKNILPVRNLVDVRCDFEQRISNFFESNIKE